MEIEEAIERLKTINEFIGEEYPIGKAFLRNYEKAVKTLLSAYEKEKEKNKILLQCLKDSQERCENEHLFLGNPDM